MSYLYNIVNQFLSELEKSPELLEESQNLLAVLPLAMKLRDIQKYHLLEGLIFGQSQQFFERMGEQSGQKQSLAAYCYDQCGLKDEVDEFRSQPEQSHSQLRRIFFESGSTIAYLIGHFATHIAHARKSLTDKHKQARLQRATILTNNFTGITALASLVDHLCPIEGRLSLKYYGFFPFDNNEQSLDEELKKYNYLSDDIESCEAVFATCSDFSFLMGPIVGSRDNCLTKRAMYSGASFWPNPGRQFYLLFHFDKLFPVFKNEHGCKEPGPNCSYVFFSRNDLIDAAKAEYLGKQHDHFEKIRQETPMWNISPPKSYTDDFFQRNQASWATKSLALDSSWADFLSNAQGMNILISLDMGDVAQSLETLKKEINRVNQIIKIAQCPFEYFIKNENQATTDLVAHVCVKRMGRHN